MEANVIYRIARGDEAALEAFMDHYSSTLYRYAFGITGNREMAEDVVSEVFFEVWKNRKSLLEIESMGAWLRTVTYHKAVSSVRKEDARPQGVPLDDVEEFTVAPVSGPASDLISREEMDQLNNAISSLPPKCRHVFFLAKIEKMPYKELAKMLGISVATINYHVGFAIDSLKKILRRGQPPPD